MSFTDDNNKKRTDPIIIPARGRARSASMSSSSTCSSPDLITPSCSAGRMSPSTSPILSYFLAQPPTKSASPTNTFPFRKFGAAPVFEEEESEAPATLHARRASATISTRFTQPPSSFVATEAHVERGTNLLRRLSLGASAFNNKPQTDQKMRSGSPPIAKSTTSTPLNKPRRSATISTHRRAPSPMGERILKGHFDGFN